MGPRDCQKRPALDDGLWLQVLAHAELNPVESARVQATCRQLCRVARDNALWYGTEADLEALRAARAADAEGPRDGFWRAANARLQAHSPLDKRRFLALCNYGAHSPKVPPPRFLAMGRLPFDLQVQAARCGLLRPARAPRMDYGRLAQLVAPPPLSAAVAERMAAAAPGSAPPRAPGDGAHPRA